MLSHDKEYCIYNLGKNWYGVWPKNLLAKKIQCVFWIGLAAKRLLGLLKCMGFLSDGGTIMKYAWRGARVFNVLKEEADDEARPALTCKLLPLRPL